MSNDFPRKIWKPFESTLNVTNLPPASGQAGDLLLRLLVWLLWKDTMCFGSVLRLGPLFCSGTQGCPCLSHCRINIASSKSQNPSVSLLFIYKIKFQLQKMVHFFLLLLSSLNSQMWCLHNLRGSPGGVDSACIFYQRGKLKVVGCLANMSSQNWEWELLQWLLCFVWVPPPFYTSPLPHQCQREVCNEASVSSCLVDGWEWSC